VVIDMAINMAIDKDRIKQAIQKAERRTSGEIRVSVSPLFWGDVRKAAGKAFERLGMTATKDRNAVLFFVVPARRKFVVLGDSGIHEKVGQEFWHHIVRTVSGKFKQGDFTGGLVAGIEAVGEDLAKHFPYHADSDINELPDEVDECLWGANPGRRPPFEPCNAVVRSASSKNSHSSLRSPITPCKIGLTRSA
jgi:uncharacterized membrane protein